MSAQPEPSPAYPYPVDEHVFLIGRPPVGDLLGFVRMLAVDGQMRSTAELVDEWRHANDHLREVESREAGLADNPVMATLSAGLAERRRQLLDDPVFQATFQAIPSDVYTIDLDRLVVFQRHIDLTHVDRLRSRLSEKPSQEELFDFCLPVHPERPPVRAMQTGPNSFTFVSPSNDFRFQRTDLVERARVAGLGAIGTTTGALSLLFGYSSNFLTAISLEERLILVNGSHRAYALREAGVRRVPCVVLTLSRRDELELAGLSEIRQRPELYLSATRPPMLKDYFDPNLRTIVPVARKQRLVRVSFNVETCEIPA